MFVQYPAADKTYLKFFFKIVSGFLFSCIYFSAHALISNAGTWDGLVFSNKPSRKTEIILLTEQRVNFDNPSLNELLIRGAFAYHVGSGLSFWVGGDYFQAYRDKNRNRQAAWEQARVILRTSDPFTLTFRSRFEQITNRQLAGLALRQRNLIQITLLGLPYQIKPVIYDEFFFNINHPFWVSAKTLSQNRVGVGFEKAINKNVILYCGYLNRMDYLPNFVFLENLFAVSMHFKFH